MTEQEATEVCAFLNERRVIPEHRAQTVLQSHYSAGRDYKVVWLDKPIDAMRKGYWEVSH